MHAKKLVIAFCVLSVSLPPLPVYPQALPATTKQAAEYIFVIIDRSRSIKDLPDNTIQSMLIHLLKTASLSGDNVHVGVVTYSGREIKVYGDPNRVVDGLEMPSPAHDQLLRRVLEEWKEPSGSTPLDIALEDVLLMRNSLPPDAKVTVINFGDGHPHSGWFRPQDFPGVREYVKDKIEDIEKLDYPREIKDEMIEQYWQDLENPESKESQRVLRMQSEEEFDICKVFADALGKSGVRLVTFAFAEVPELKSIHDAGSAVEEDYVVVDPASRVVSYLHNLGLTALPRLIRLVPNEQPEDNTAFEADIPLVLPAIGDRAVITALFDKPYDNFAEHSRIALSVDGVKLEVDFNDQSDPSVVIGKDESGRVASMTWTLDAIPADERVVIHYDSPEVSHTVPAMTILSHLRIADDLELLFRPLNRSGSESPIIVSPNQNQEYVAALLKGESGLPYPITAMQAVLLGRDSAGQPVNMVAELGTPGQFLTQDPLQLERGKYSLDIYMELPGGTQFNLHIPEHIVCELKDEYITAEIVNSELSQEIIQAPELGDELLAFEAEIVIRPGKDVQYGIPLALSIHDLIDSKGNAFTEKIISISREQFVTSKNGTRVRLSFQIPQNLAGVENGICSGWLRIVRTDLGQPIEVRNYAYPNSNQDPTEIKFALNQPQFSLSARRLFFNELQTTHNAAKGKLRIHVDVGTPIHRVIHLLAKTTSILPRDCVVQPIVPFFDANGRPYKDVNLRLVNGSKMQTLQPRALGSWKYRLEIPETVEFRRLFAKIVILGHGMQSSELPVEIVMADEMLGPEIQAKSSLAAWLLSAGSIMCLTVGLIISRRFGRGARHVVTRQKPGILVSLQGNYVQIEGRNVHMQPANEPRSKPAPRRIPFDRFMVDQRNRVVLFEKNRNKGKGLAVEVIQKKVVRGEPTLTTVIRQSGHHAQRIQRYRRWCRRLALPALVGLALAVFATHPWAIARLQELMDLGRLPGELNPSGFLRLAAFIRTEKERS